ncbi:hypothetical protein HYU14_00940 [Candidatus Woesearchaeota archaeon]|nr:hypothetical protein [Candidatus Woesearchaeota archaeon]
MLENLMNNKTKSFVYPLLVGFFQWSIFLIISNKSGNPLGVFLFSGGLTLGLFYGLFGLITSFFYRRNITVAKTLMIILLSIFIILSIVFITLIIWSAKPIKGL